MKDGYYLSTYLIIDKNLQRFSNQLFRHDNNFSLWKKTGEKIELIEYYELERYTGEKHHDRGFPDVETAKNYINRLLSKRGLSISDMCEVWGTYELQTNKFRDTDECKNYAYHAICHLFSAVLLNTDIFYTEKILALAVDGGPDICLDYKAFSKFAYVGAYIDKGDLKLFPISSPGKLWGMMSYRVKLREGTLMALVNSIKSKTYLSPIPSMLIFKDNIKISNILGDILDSMEKQVSSTYINKGETMFHYDNRFTYSENMISNMMKNIQAFSINTMRNNIERQIEKYNIKPSETYLAISGGYALNCPTNSFLMDYFGFKGFLAPPCPNDSGQSLGIALYSFYKGMNRFKFNLQSAYYGYQDDQVMDTLNGTEFGRFIENIEPYSEEQFVSDVCKQPVIWFNDQAEIGPRSLGNRSILGDPRKKRLKIF